MLGFRFQLLLNFLYTLLLAALIPFCCFYFLQAGDGQVYNCAPFCQSHRLPEQASSAHFYLTVSQALQLPHIPNSPTSSLLKCPLLFLYHFSEQNQRPPSCLNEKLVPLSRLPNLPFPPPAFSYHQSHPSSFCDFRILCTPAAASLITVVTAFLKLMFGSSTTLIFAQTPALAQVQIPSFGIQLEVSKWGMHLLCGAPGIFKYVNKSTLRSEITTIIIQ